MAYTGSRLAAIETAVQTLSNDPNFIDRPQFIALCNLCLNELSRRRAFVKTSEITTVASQESYALSTNLARVAYCSGSAASNLGAGKTGIPANLHGFTVGESVTIAGTVNYNGWYTLQAQTTTNLLAIISTYIAETPPTSANAQGTANYGRLLTCWYDDTATEPMVPADSWHDFEYVKRNGTGIGIPDTPTLWIVKDETLYVWPAPSASADTIYVDHTYRPTQFSELYHYTPQTGEMYDDIYVAYALWKKFDRDYASKYAKGESGTNQQWFEEIYRQMRSDRAHHKTGFQPYR